MQCCLQVQVKGLVMIFFNTFAIEPRPACTAYKIFERRIDQGT